MYISTFAARKPSNLTVLCNSELTSVFCLALPDSSAAGWVPPVTAWWHTPSKPHSERWQLLVWMWQPLSWWITPSRHRERIHVGMAKGQVWAWGGASATFSGWLTCSWTQPWVRMQRNHLGILYGKPKCNSARLSSWGSPPGNTSQTAGVFTMCIFSFQGLILTPTLRMAILALGMLVREIGWYFNLVLTGSIKFCPCIQNLGDGRGKGINMMKAL